MGLQRFLSLLAACIGLVGAIFLAKGIIILSPKAILHLTSPYSRIGYALEQIASMAVQKADALIGVLFIFLAFLIQVCALVFAENDIPFIKTKWIGFWIAMTIVSILTIIFSFVDLGIRDHIKLQAGKIAIRNFCTKRFTNVVDLTNAKCLEMMSQELIGINRGIDEPRVDFIKRIAKYVNWSYPDDIDFSKIRNEANSR